MRRREFIAELAGAAVAFPHVARAQQPALPIVGVLNGGSADASADRLRGFRKGLGETGYVEGRNVTVEYHFVDGQYDRLPALIADLVRRRVAVIATPDSNVAATAAKAAPRRSRSCSASLKTRSSLVLSRASAGRAAT